MTTALKINDPTHRYKPEDQVRFDHDKANARRFLDNPGNVVDGYALNFRNQADSLTMLSSLPDGYTKLVVFDPQYRGILDLQGYGNEGDRQKGRAALPQMSDESIHLQALQIQRILAPNGYVLMWADKLMICSGQLIPFFTENGRTDMKLVDMVTWAKGTFGMGSRTRYTAEYAVLIQKRPANGSRRDWAVKNIRDVWFEPIESAEHVHQKPYGLQQTIIFATTQPGDVVVDPSAGSFSVMKAANAIGRDFLGCDLLPKYTSDIEGK